MPKKFHTRRLLIIAAIILMIISYFAGHALAGNLILVALILLGITLLLSRFNLYHLGCINAGQWFQFWWYDEELKDERDP